VTGAPRTALLLLGSVALVALGYRRARRAYLGGDPLTGAVIVGAVAVAVTPISWMHHQVLLVVAAACTVDAGRRLQWLWPVLVLGVMLLPQVQSTVDSLVPAGLLVTDDLQFLLAVAIAAFVPFRYPADQRGHVRDTLTVTV
jgi:alpha-1,2-mannosyltransferase